MSEENLSMPRCDIEELKEENQQLKELLRECKPLLNSHPRKFKLKYLLTRINAAIGESEE